MDIQTHRLLLVSPVADTGTQVVETLALNDIVEHTLVFLTTVPVFPAGNPAHVSQTQSPRLDLDVLGRQALGNLVAVRPRLDLAAVEDEHDVVGAPREGDGVRGVERWRGTLLA